MKATNTSGPDFLHSIAFLEIDLLVRQKEYSKALSTLEELAIKLEESPLDIYQHIKVMIAKAHIYDQAGVPQKGVSVALRAATLAYNAKILPALWDAVRAICAILHSLKEFKASIQLMESIMPQVLECEDCSLTAHSYSMLADAHVGQAGKVRSQLIQYKEHLSKGLENLGQAFDEYSRIENITGQCEMLAKKATIMHLNGDAILANDCASQYLSIRKAAKEVA